jgi:hypothetical protein
MKKLISLILALSALKLSAQITNFAPVQLAYEHDHLGLTIEFNSQPGRLYHLEESTTLTNWTLVQQFVGSGELMTYSIEFTNVIDFGEGGTNSGPPPGFDSMSQANSASAEDTENRPPYPWEAAYLSSLGSEQNFFIEATTSSESSSSESIETPPEAKFYRVVCPEDRIQFPGWLPYVDQFAQFVIWTPLQGTYRLEVFTDGVSIYDQTAAVPSNDTLA